MEKNEIKLATFEAKKQKSEQRIRRYQEELSPKEDKKYGKK